MGSGATGVVAKKMGHYYAGIEFNPEFIKMAKEHIQAVSGPLEYLKRKAV